MNEDYEEVSMDEVIATSLNDLNSLEIGSLEYRNACEGIGKLCEANAKMYEAEIKAANNQKQIEIEEKKIDSEKERSEKDRKQTKLLNILHVAADIGIAGIGIFLHQRNIKKGFEYEQTGVITSPTLKRTLGDDVRMLFKRIK